MNIDRSLIGWIVAAVLAVALGGVIIYNVSTGDDGRPAALGGGASGGQPIPSEIAADVEQIQENKPETEDHSIPDVPADEKPRTLAQNPRPVCNPDLPANAFATWENNPQNLNQANEMADQVVVGTVQGVQKGTAYTNAVEGEPGGSVSYPTQRVTIQVEQAIKGSANEGGTITVERLGDAAGCFRVEGEPAYSRGQEYLLLLENGREGHPMHPISPSGRFQVTGDNSLRPAHPGNGVAEDIAGQKLDQVANRLGAAG